MLHQQLDRVVILIGNGVGWLAVSTIKITFAERWRTSSFC